MILSKVSMDPVPETLLGTLASLDVFVLMLYSELVCMCSDSGENPIGSPHQQYALNNF